MRVLWIGSWLVLACAHPPRAPEVSGWRELRSAHFRLQTDLSLTDARTTLDRLETLRAALETAWAGGGDTPGSTRAIVLHDPAELRTFTDLRGAAGTSRSGPLLVTAGVEVPLGDASPDLAVLAHEVAHDLNRRRMPGAPRWFDEGLAEYLESAELLDPERVRFGRTSTEVLEAARGGPPIPIPRLEGPGWESETPDQARAAYRSARLWIHALRASEPERMRSLESALASGTPWRAAWGEVERSVDLPGLEEDLRRWVQVGVLPTELHRFERRTTRPDERPLPEWEVHLALAELWALGSGADRAARSRAEIEAAARAAPDEAGPQVLLADLETDPDRKRELAEALARRHPRSPEAAVLLARVLRDQGGPVEGRRAAIDAALALAPDDVDALTAHALESARNSEFAGALRSARRAVALAPWNPTVFTTLALVLSRVGSCSEAVAAAQHAVDVLPDHPDPRDVAALDRERDRIARSCSSLPGGNPVR